MIEGGAGPRSRRVARVAGSRVTRRNVVWHRAAQSLRAVPIRLVTAVARCIRGAQTIVVAGVAKIASRSEVGAGQSPASAGMIKSPIRPTDLIMAGGALCGCLRVVHCDVVGYRAADARSAVVIGLMTADAVGRRITRRVIVPDVTLVAIRCGAAGSHLVIAH